MSILIFIIILAVLILVHEFGHFIVAKKNGIRVDEFGIGFPPKLYGKKFGETEYTLNLFPIGGFVKIFGETPNEESISGPDSRRSFVHKPKWVQAAVISAGVFFNILLAWVLISIGFMIGLPTPVDVAPASGTIRDVSVVVTSVLPESPAEIAGLKTGDRISSYGRTGQLVSAPQISDIQSRIADSFGNEVIFGITRGKETLTLPIVPTEGIIDEGFAIGISMSDIGIVSLPPHLALWEGGKLTATLTSATFLGLIGFFGGLFSGSADLSAVAGPVGIVGIVGDAASFGFVYLISLAALISINLAIINLLPFPALDGGRLLFIIIEIFKGSAIKPHIANTVNAIGFGLLILLMLVITYNDIVRIITT